MRTNSILDGGGALSHWSHQHLDTFALIVLEDINGRRIWRLVPKNAALIVVKHLKFLFLCSWVFEYVTTRPCIAVVIISYVLSAMG